MFKFLSARHRSAYTNLALKYKVWPEKVYKLAHGKHAHSKKEHQIVHELLALGIIHPRSIFHPDARVSGSPYQELRAAQMPVERQGICSAACGCSGVLVSLEEEGNSDTGSARMSLRISC